MQAPRTIGSEGYPAKYVMAGRPVCPFINCPEKAANIPHWHNIVGGVVKTHLQAAQ